MSGEPTGLQAAPLVGGCNTLAKTDSLDPGFQVRPEFRPVRGWLMGNQKRPARQAFFSTSRP